MENLPWARNVEGKAKDFVENLEKIFEPYELL
jgi:hypothetical protein